MLSKRRFENIRKYIKYEYESPIIITHANEIDPNEFIVNKCISIESSSFDIELEKTFSETLLELIDKRGLSDAKVYKAAMVDRRLFSKMRSNVNYKPSKRIALSFCIALKLNLDETDDLLERAGFALSRSDRTDLIVRHYLEEYKYYSLQEVNEALIRFKEKPLTKY